MRMAHRAGLLLAGVVVASLVPATAVGEYDVPSVPTSPVFDSAAPPPRTPATDPIVQQASRVVRSAPAFADRIPARTRQVVRTVSSRRWCRKEYCTVTQAWRKRSDGRWVMVRRFRSTIGPEGFGKRREGDLKSPRGVYRIKVTFSTGDEPPGEMRWRRRLPTSAVLSSAGRLYNTWVEQKWRTDGDRPAMRVGFVVDYNNIRLRPGVGPKPVAGKGSGIFYHTSRPGHRWSATLGCTQLGRPKNMRWLVKWLDPDARPRVVQDI